MNDNNNTEAPLPTIEGDKDRKNEKAEDPNKIPVRHSRIGEAYQAIVKKDVSHENRDEKSEPTIECIWDCNKTTEGALESYINNLKRLDPEVPREMLSVEKALGVLHDSGYSIERAEETVKSNPTIVVDPDMKWNNGDSNMFEFAYLHYGNDLNEIAKFLKPKTVAQVQRHYYQWKYGKRYRSFLEKNDLLSSSEEEKEDEEEEEEEEDINDTTNNLQQQLQSPPPRKTKKLNKHTHI